MGHAREVGVDADIRARLFTPAFFALAMADLAYFTAAGILIPIVPLFLGASCENVDSES